MKRSRTITPHCKAPEPVHTPDIEDVKKTPKWISTLLQCTQTTQNLSGYLSDLGDAARIFGMEGLSSQLNSVSKTLLQCSQDIDRANVQAQTDRFKQAEQSSANVVNAALAGAETARDNRARVEHVHSLERVAALARTYISDGVGSMELQDALNVLDDLEERPPEVPEGTWDWETFAKTLKTVLGEYDLTNMDINGILLCVHEGLKAVSRAQPEDLWNSPDFEPPEPLPSALSYEEETYLDCGHPGPDPDGDRD